MPIHFVLADVATREHNDLVRRHDLVYERIRKAMQEGAPHLLIVTDRSIHLWVQAEKADRRVDFRDEGAAKTGNPTLIPASGLPNLRARLRPKTDA